LDLAPVPAVGTPDYGTDTNALLPALVGCSAGSPTNPLFQCNGAADLKRVIRHSMSSGESAIYGAAITPPDDCAGSFWEYGALAQREGWVCVAATATDTVGNKGISRPMRFCLDREDGGDDPCPGGLAAAPTCRQMVNGPSGPVPCALPPAFEPQIVKRRP
jgi:hypothetical protein